VGLGPKTKIMQYSVPQFVEVEDKIIGPLTLKQFLIVLAGGLVVFTLWQIFKASIVFFVAVLPIVVVVAGLAFGKFNGRPFLANVVDLARYFLSSKQRVFMHEAAEFTVLKRAESSARESAETSLDGERASRLKRLAYILDQKTAEEERLIHSGKMGEQWLNKI